MKKLMGSIIVYGFFDFCFIRLFIEVPFKEIPWYNLLFIALVLLSEVYEAANYIDLRSRAIKELYEYSKKMKAELEELKKKLDDKENLP